MHGKSTSKVKEPVLISSKLEWVNSCFRHVFVKIDQSANTRGFHNGLHITKNAVLKERLKRPYAITRLTAHFMSGVMSDLVVCKFRKSMVILGTEYPF